VPRPAETPQGPDAVRRDVRIASGPETVFEFLTDATKRILWAGTHAESDPRLGGAHRTVINPGHIVSGEYVEVLPHRRVVCTWGWVDSPAMPPGSTVVQFDLAPDGNGTVLRVTHAKLPETARRGHGEVWDHYLPRLAVAAAGGDPGPDPWAD
jgi:uncharacterized protein YndB with AHSA1/START domain